MYENITKYIGAFAECGEWINGDDDTPRFAYSDIVDDFLDDMQNFLVWDYDVVLDQIKEKLNLSQISAEVDASLLDEEEVLSLITGIVTREKFIPGMLASYLRGGAIDRWLTRLKQLDEDESRIRKIKVVWSEKLPLDEMIESHLSQTDGLYYISYQNGDNECSLNIGGATYSTVKEHLTAQKDWWKNAIPHKIYARVGITSDVDEALSAILCEMSGNKNNRVELEHIKG
ncbi:MAG: hypothetical protein IJC83_04960 [Oscillospiraceae bacterium]|nr:hypothetical protein [Oscillospiraceae bacterium]